MDRGRFPTHEELYNMELDYPISHQARILLRIVPEFFEPIDVDVPTDVDRWYQDSDIESDAEDQSDDCDADADDGYD